VSEQQSDADVARRAAVEQAVSTLTYVAVMVAMSWLLLQRDVLRGLWKRLRHPPMSPEAAREARMLAELRRDIAAFEHPARPAPRPRGLYEPPA
jgi:hypothetical protein